MGQIVSNPVISRTPNIGAPLVLYLADSFAIFGCFSGNPEGQGIFAGKRSLAITDTQGVFFKSTDNNVDTGWLPILMGVQNGFSATAPQILDQSFTQTGNVGGGEDNINTFTIPPNLVTFDNDVIEIDVSGRTAANANNKTIRSRFPTGVINLDTGVLPVSDKDWTLRTRIIRSGALAGIVVQDFAYESGAFLTTVNQSPAGVDWSASQQFRVTGESAASASNDVISNYRTVRLYRAPPI